MLRKSKDGYFRPFSAIFPNLKSQNTISFQGGYRKIRKKVAQEIRRPEIAVV